MSAVMQSILGIAVFVCIAVLASKSRSSISWRYIALAILSQFVIAFTFIHIEFARSLLGVVTYFAKTLEAATQKSTSFVLGYVGSGDLPFEVIPGSSTFIFAFQVLPVIMVIGALSALLWHWKILGYIVAAGAWIVRKVLGVSEPVGFASVANAFLGMIESPLLIKPYLPRLTSSELFTVMSVGMSTIAGGTAVIISSIFGSDESAFSNVVTATLMNVPGAIAFSAIIVPSLQNTSATNSERVAIVSPYRSSMDAIVVGTADGVKIFVNVVSLLIVFMAIVALIDGLLSTISSGLSVSTIFSYVLAPVAWLIGIPAQEVFLASEILSLKVAVNELVAYTRLEEQFVKLSQHSSRILTFALCGFGNFGSLAIMIGGLSAMAEERRDEIISYGLWALLVAFLTNNTTAAIAAIVFSFS